MKIGILTHQYINNYGAFLQAWALREAIAELFPNDEVQIIDYVNLKHFIINAGGWFRFYKNRESFKDWMEKIKLPRTFAKARNQEMILSKRCFNAKQINALDFDCIIVGSDEVWNYKDTKGNAALKFGEGLTCKNLIAYAPSVGKTAADECVPEYVIRGIKKFKKISARDDLTEQLVCNITGTAPERVLDPTFLAEFPRAELAAKKKPYILFYYCENLPHNILNQIFSYAKEHGLAVYGAGECDKRYSEITVNLMPFEWVEMFRKNEIKSHHYIISFDPRDSTENCLTGKRAQELGLEYAKANFPGHQALVCTHMDGHNGSGNIHVHIVINSLRKLDVPQQPFMERPIDCKAGYKHHVTNEYLKHLQKSLMDLCQREFLHQVDLLSPSRTGVTEAEYWAQRWLDEKKQEIEEKGFTPNPTKFQTQKQLIRDAVAAAREKAISYEDFQEILQDEYDVFVKTQRGRYSYLLPERNKFISERSLGDSCKRECLEGFFIQNAERNLRYKEDPILIFTTRTRLRLVVDLQENVKAQENLAYALKVKISNLQKMAETLVWVQENNINDLAELNDLCKTAQANAQAAYERLSQAEDELYKTNEQIHYAGQYLSTKEVQQQFAKAIFKKKFRAEHSKELDAYAESVKYFREENDGKLPSLKSLKKRKEELIKEIVEKKKAYAPLKEESRRLEIASDNVYSIFRKTNEMKSDLAWKREWEAKVREKARQEQARQEQRARQPKRKKRSYDMSL